MPNDEPRTFEPATSTQPPTPSDDPPWYKKTWVKYVTVLLIGLFIGTIAATDDADNDPATAELSDVEDENQDLLDRIDELEQEVARLEDELEDAQEDSTSEDTSNQDTSQDDSTNDSSDSTDDTTNEDTNDTTDTQDTDPEGDFTDGTHQVPEDVTPNLYRATPTSNCYWERLDGFSGSIEDVNANGNHDSYPILVQITNGDNGFKSQNCGWWTSDITPLKDPGEPRGDGMWLVGDEMQEGTWSAPGGEYCYWERLSGFTHEIEDIEANGNPTGTVIVEVADSDTGFHARGCGEWSLT